MLILLVGAFCGSALSDAGFPLSLITSFWMGQAFGKDDPLPGVAA